MPDVLVLGPQFRSPNIRDALARTGLSGPVVTITAGWQEREGELAALEGHLGHPVRDLRLYERAEAVFNQDAELHETHRRRQADLRRLQELYRIRLSHAKTAARELFATGDDSELMRNARRAALSAIRRLDAEHLKAIGRIHARWDARLGVGTQARARPPAGGTGAPGRKGRRRLPRRRARRGTVESAAPVRPGAAAAHTPRRRVVGRRDGDLGAHRAVPRPPAAGRRATRRFSKRGSASCAAPCSCPTPRRVSRSATATACRCSHAG